MEEKLEQLTLLQSALVGLGVAAFYYFFIYSVTNSDAQLQTMETQIIEANQSIQAVDALIREKQELEAELLKNAELVKSSYGIVTVDFEPSVALEKLTVKARSFGLSIESIGSFENWSSEDQFETSELNLSLRGTFGQVMFFISDFTREEGFYGFESVKLAPIGDSGSQKAKKSDVLNVSMTIQILRLIKRIGADPSEEAS